MLEGNIEFTLPIEKLFKMYLNIPREAEFNFPEKISEASPFLKIVSDNNVARFALVGSGKLSPGNAINQVAQDHEPLLAFPGFEKFTQYLNHFAFGQIWGQYYYLQENIHPGLPDTDSAKKAAEHFMKAVLSIESRQLPIVVRLTAYWLEKAGMKYESEQIIVDNYFLNPPVSEGEKAELKKIMAGKEPEFIFEVKAGMWSSNNLLQ